MAVQGESMSGATERVEPRRRRRLLAAIAVLADFTPEGDVPAEGAQHGPHPSVISIDGRVLVADDGSVSIEM